MKKAIPLLLALLGLLALAGCGSPAVEYDAKPVLYLYPEEETTVNVQLDYHGQLTTTYPAYGDGWTVTAHPDGTLTDPATGREHYCLFWEGVSPVEYDFSEGFVVPGNRRLPGGSLATLGLTDQEANEFLIYWLPKMEGNPYNLIAFQDEVYTKNAALSISPAPDTLLRIFMAWKGLEEPVEIEPQVLTPTPRTGFTVVEWGGAEVQ